MNLPRILHPRYRKLSIQNPYMRKDRNPGLQENCSCHLSKENSHSSHRLHMRRLGKPYRWHRMSKHLRRYIGRCFRNSLPRRLRMHSVDLYPR